MTLKARGRQYRAGEVSEVEDRVAVESVFHLYLNGRLVTHLVASPAQLSELAVGFVVSEGLATRINSVAVAGSDLCVVAPGVDGDDEWVVRSAGVGASRTPPAVTSTATVQAADVPGMIREIESEVWRQTGGVHCAVLFQGPQIAAKSCDIGRHNAVDKVIGHAVLNGIDLGQCVLGCTGRQPSGMVSKVAHAGIPIVLSKAATTCQGIALAERTGVTLVCFARGDRFTVYAHPERIVGLEEGK